MVGRTQLKGSWRCWSRSAPQSSVMAAAEARGMVCYGLVNVFGSILAKVVSLCLPLCCGYEISVPATKTFTNQVITSLVLACRMARRDCRQLDAIPGLMQTAIDATAPPPKPSPARSMTGTTCVVLDMDAPIPWSSRAP